MLMYTLRMYYYLRGELPSKSTYSFM